MNWQKYESPSGPRCVRTTFHQTLATPQARPCIPGWFCRSPDVVAARHRGVPWTDQGSVRVARRNIRGGVETNQERVLKISRAVLRAGRELASLLLGYRFLSNMRPRRASPSIPPRSQYLSDLCSKHALSCGASN